MVTREDQCHYSECHPLPSSPPRFIYLLSMTWYGMEYAFGQPGSAVPAVSPPSSLCTPSPLAGGVGREAAKALALCKPCSALMKTSLYYQQCFQHKPKAQPRTSYCEENELCPSQNQHTQLSADTSTFCSEPSNGWHEPIVPDLTQDALSLSSPALQTFLHLLTALTS